MGRIGRSRGASGSRGGSRRGPALLILALAMVGAAAAYLLRPGDALPAEVSGRWSSEAEKYAGRSLDLTPDSIRFYSGPDEYEAYQISRVEREEDGSRGTRYRVHYGQGAAAGTLSFFYQHGVLRLENQPDFEWRK